MQRTGKYTKDDPMSDLVSDNYRILLLMSRFGIGLGFGESSIGEVCRANGVDTSTFLIVTNMMLYDEIPADAYDKVSMEGLLSYLHNSHDYFLGFRLPAIREKLAAAVGTGSDLSRAIMKYFDDYTAGVHTHIAYEEEVVFPYVRALLEGRRQQDYSIDIFSRHHDQVETLLTEFKNILIKYYPSASTNEINNVLFDIFNCENDLASHNAVEDLLFVPAVGRLEKSGGGRMSVTVKITVAEPSVIIRSGIIAVIGSAENLKAEIYEVSEIDQLRNVLSWQHPDILLVNPASLGLFPLQQLKKDTGNPDMKCVALQFAFTDHAALKSYDDAISVYDSAETVNDKLARLVSEPERDKRHESLSGREKEVIACVVQGMTNKQIADKLFISTHTVITHRRNISAKLGIHSPAGLTIYAIVNKLVELDDIKDSVEEQLPGD